MDEDTTWYGGLCLDDIVLDGELPPQGKEHSSSPAPSFRPMPIAAKRSPISATAELLLYLNPHIMFSRFAMRMKKIQNNVGMGAPPK